jgi:polyphenol oxidase
VPLDYEGSTTPMMTRKDKDLAQFRTSALLTEAGFRHAFFMRGGGVSAGAYASLSFSIAAGDTVENVGRNLERAAAALGVPAERVYFLSQVHGRDVVSVTGTEDRAEVVLREGDALVAADPGCAAGVRTADCLPILVADTVTGGVVAIHAGWKGLVAAVIEAGIERLREVTGARGDLVAAIGPHITVKSFEVSDDVATTLAGCSSDHDVVERTAGAKPHVDLARIARAQLVAAGVPRASIDVVPGCTYRDADDFFSFRRDGARSGRHLSAIVPRSRA